MANQEMLKAYYWVFKWKSDPALREEVGQKVHSPAPLVSPCCNRIIGCRACVTTWRNTNTRCPLCSISGRMAEAFELKGIDDFTALFCAGESSGNIEASSSADVDTVTTGSNDEFEDLPPVNVSVPQS